MLGLVHNLPRWAVRVRNLGTDKVVAREATTWHPYTKEPGLEAILDESGQEEVKKTNGSSEPGKVYSRKRIEDGIVKPQQQQQKQPV